MVQQKKRKQLILTDDENIFTYCFQPIQRLQPNFKTDGITNFIYTKHNRDNAKIKIFSFIQQRQRIPPNFMNYTYQTTKQPVCALTTKFWFLQLRPRKFWNIHIQISQQTDQCRTFYPSPISAFHRFRKSCTWLDEQFRTFHPPLHESIPSF